MVETRSQRQAYLQRPPYPQISTQSASSSAAGSAFQSSSSLSSISSASTPGAASIYSGVPQSSPSMLSQQTPFAQSAPLPSPSAGAASHQSYFNALAAQQMQMGHAPTSHPSYQQQQRIPQQYQQSAGAYLGQRGGDGGGVPETAPFLKDFNLVAEAAKRAQMACLSRDLGDIGL
jgi:hypothetical protein